MISNLENSNASKKTQKKIPLKNEKIKQRQWSIGQVRLVIVRQQLKTYNALATCFFLRDCNIKAKILPHIQFTRTIWMESYPPRCHTIHALGTITKKCYQILFNVPSLLHYTNAYSLALSTCALITNFIWSQISLGLHSHTSLIILHAKPSTLFPYHRWSCKTRPSCALNLYLFNSYPNYIQRESQR